MNYDSLKKIERNYSEYLKKQPFFESTKVEKNEVGKFALWICYHKGMTIAKKKEIATELGDVPLKWFMLEETQK